MRIKFLCLTLLAVLAGGGFCQSAEAAGTLRHKAEVRLEPAIRHIQVTDEIELEATGETVRFRLSRLLRPSLVEVDGVRVTPSSGPEGWSVPTGGRGPRRLVIRYEGVLAELDSGGSPFGGTDPGSGEDGSYLPGGTAWLPGFDDPGPADYRVAITVPKGYRPVMTGRLEDEALGRAVFTFDGASEEPSLFAGRWNVRERVADGLRLRTYFEPDLEGLSDDYLEASEGYIRRFSERIGQYPFDGFSILSAPLPVGLGFESLTYIGRQVLPLPFMRGQSLPHEILHNWWGNGVLVDYETGNWSEGLTTYMADYGLTEERSAEAAREMRLGWLRDVAALPPERDGTLAGFKARVHGAAQIVGYNKSAYLFLMLNDLLGQDAFDRGIRLFWERHRFKRAGWAELRSAFEEASGTDLEAFFQQWVQRRGAPSVQLETIAAKRAGDGYEMTVRIGQGQPFYRLAVPLAVETASRNRHAPRRGDRTADRRNAEARCRAPMDHARSRLPAVPPAGSGRSSPDPARRDARSDDPHGIRGAGAGRRPRLGGAADGYGDAGRDGLPDEPGCSDRHDGCRRQGAGRTGPSADAGVAGGQGHGAGLDGTVRRRLHGAGDCGGRQGRS